MSRIPKVDQEVIQPAGDGAFAPVSPAAVRQRPMTSFVESCLETVAGSAVAAERRSRRKPRGPRLLKALAGKKNILVTTHQYPDPDALVSSLALTKLLQRRLKGSAEVTLAVRGLIQGGLNAALTVQPEFQASASANWDEESLRAYDAIILLDVQPAFRFSPLPPGIEPTAVIDHHRSRRRGKHAPFSDIRTDVGATCSIVFSYYMELEEEIDRDLAANLLYAIETDLAGAAGTPGELDNVALSSLTLLADPRKLYRMRFVNLPQSYYIAYNAGVANAIFYDSVLISHVDAITSPETPAVIADFLLRFDQVNLVLVTATTDKALLLSLRTRNSKISAADLMRRLLKNLGEGGGHGTKAGGIINLESGSQAEMDRLRKRLRRRLLRALKIDVERGQRLIPKPSGGKTL